MSIDVDEVKKIAKLAALNVKDEDLQSRLIPLALRRCRIHLMWSNVCEKTWLQKSIAVKIFRQ
jgi:hypothetical protein